MPLGILHVLVLIAQWRFMFLTLLNLKSFSKRISKLLVLNIIPFSSSSRYSTDFGMFRFCIADTEHDWREGTEQYRFIEHCLASVDRQKQPWLIFLAHRVLGYSSSSFYAEEGSFAEPMGRDDLQKLWQKYKVDIAMYGHVHNYERTCPIYQVCSDVSDLIHVSLLHFELTWKSYLIVPKKPS